VKNINVGKIQETPKIKKKIKILNKLAASAGMKM